MNLNEAIGHASTLFMPEFLFGMDDDLLEGERAINEEALHLLIEEYFSNPNPSFGFDLVLDLADRNRSISDMMPPETVGGDRSRSRNLPSGLSDADILRGIATMQHRRVETLEKEVAGMNATRGVLYGSKPSKGALSAHGRCSQCLKLHSDGGSGSFSFHMSNFVRHEDRSFLA